MTDEQKPVDISVKGDVNSVTVEFAEPPEPGQYEVRIQVPMKLRVQVGDVIRRGRGEFSQTVMIVWTNRPWVPGATDATATEHERPSEKAHPADAICLVPPRGNGQFMGTALMPDFMTYLGFLHFTDDEQNAADEADDEYAARDGHTWEVNASGYEHVTTEWWETFRAR